MDSAIEDVIKKIVLLPFDFNNIRTKSANTLVKESGYLEFYSLIHENEIIEILNKQPHLISEWLQWSDDQRSTPSTFFKRGEDGWCIVGHYPYDMQFKEINTSDVVFACAAFIKLQVESIRLHFINNNE